MTNREGVRQAALMLDKEVPGWEKRIDPETLLMSDCFNCALGQIFGPRVESKIWKTLGPEARRIRRSKSITSGFIKGLRNPTIREYHVETNAFCANPQLKCMWIEEATNRLYPEDKDESETRSSA